MNLVENLIELVGQNRCLYDKTHQKFRDKRTRDRMWKEISAKLGIEELKCKTKWRGIKARYLREVRSKQSEAGDFTAMKKEWKYFHMLSFLNGINAPTKETNYENAELVTSLVNVYEESPLEELYIEDDFPNTSLSSNEDVMIINEAKSSNSTTNCNVVRDESVEIIATNQPAAAPAPVPVLAQVPALAPPPPPAPALEMPTAYCNQRESFYRTLIEEIKHVENGQDEVELYFKSLCKIVSFVKLTPLELLEFQSNISLKVKEVLEKLLNK